MSVSVLSSRTLLAASLVLGIAALSTPVPASAEIFMSTSAGGSCHPATAGSTAFRFTNTYAENIGTNDQYLICAFTNWDVHTSQDTGRSPDYLVVFLGAGATGGTITCVAQMGAWFSGAVHLASSATRTVTLGANANGSLGWAPSALTRVSEYETLVLNCKVPKTFKVGLLQRWEPEPASGHGWTP